MKNKKTLLLLGIFVVAAVGYVLFAGKDNLFKGNFGDIPRAQCPSDDVSCWEATVQQLTDNLQTAHANYQAKAAEVVLLERQVAAAGVGASGNKKAYEKAAAKVKKAQEAVEKLEAALARARANMELLQRKYGNKKTAALAKAEKEVRKYEEQLNKARLYLQNAVEERDRYGATQNNELENTLAAARAELQTLRNELSGLERELKQAKSNLKKAQETAARTPEWVTAPTAQNVPTKLNFAWVTPASTILNVGNQIEVARFQMGADAARAEHPGARVEVRRLNFENLSTAALTQFSLFDVTYNSFVIRNGNSSNFIIPTENDGVTSKISLEQNETRTFKILADVSTNAGSQTAHLRFNAGGSDNIGTATWDLKEGSYMARNIGWTVLFGNLQYLNSTALIAASAPSESWSKYIYPVLQTDPLDIVKPSQIVAGTTNVTFAAFGLTGTSTDIYVHKIKVTSTGTSTILANIGVYEGDRLLNDDPATAANEGVLAAAFIDNKTYTFDYSSNPILLSDSTLNIKVVADTVYTTISDGFRIFIEDIEYGLSDGSTVWGSKIFGALPVGYDVKAVYPTKLNFAWVSPPSTSLATGHQIEVARFQMGADAAHANNPGVSVKVAELEFDNLSTASLTNFVLVDTRVGTTTPGQISIYNGRPSVRLSFYPEELHLAQDETRTYKIMADVSTTAGYQTAQFVFRARTPYVNNSRVGGAEWYSPPTHYSSQRYHTNWTQLAGYAEFTESQTLVSASIPGTSGTSTPPGT